MTKFNYLLAGTASILIAGCGNLPGTQNELTAKRSKTHPTLATNLLLDDESLCMVEPDVIDGYALPVTVDLWDRIREGFVVPDQDNPRIQQQLNWYAKHPSYMQRVAERGQPYLHHIVEELEARNMPTEFALLPIVESAFDPFAYSHGRASGMWQFIPGTGKYLGLKQNWWYDGRRDVTASTDAALRYLESLGKIYDGDWLLALAAYNGGRGNVSRAIRRNKQAGKPTDFWSLDLPKETQAYVPRLLALKALVANPQQFELALLSIPDEPYFARINTDSQIDLAQAAELAEMTMEEFYLLNPGFNRWATDPEGPHHLLVPIAKAEMFQEKLAAIPKNQRVTWDRYTIKSGDSLSTIAARYNTSISGLKAINNLRGNTIRQGDVLMVPIAAEDDTHYAFSAAQRLKTSQARTAKNAAGQKVTYQVQPGDSFWTISRRYKVSVREVAKWNGMAPGDPLKIGQQLNIWTKEAHLIPESKGIVRKVAYQVRKGDSLSTIARRFRVSVADIQRWNRLNAKKYLQPGQALVLFVDVTNASR